MVEIIFRKEIYIISCYLRWGSELLTSFWVKRKESEICQGLATLLKPL